MTSWLRCPFPSNRWRWVSRLEVLAETSAAMWYTGSLLLLLSKSPVFTFFPISLSLTFFGQNHDSKPVSRRWKHHFACVSIPVLITLKRFSLYFIWCFCCGFNSYLKSHLCFTSTLVSAIHIYSFLVLSNSTKKSGLWLFFYFLNPPDWLTPILLLYSFGANGNKNTSFEVITLNQIYLARVLKGHFGLD